MGTGAQVDILKTEAGQLGEAEAGLNREQEQSVVTTASEGGAVGRGQESLDLGQVEEGDQGALETLGGDGENALDERGVLWVAEGSEAEQGVDGCEAGVAGTDGVAASGLEVGQEIADHRAVEVFEVEVAGGLADALVDEGEQQAEGVAVGGDGVGAGIELSSKAFGEEGLEGGGDCAHGSSPSVRSRRSPANASSSGDADRYQ